MAERTTGLLPEEQNGNISEDRKAVDGDKYQNILFGKTSGHIIKLALGGYVSDLTKAAMIESDKARRDDLAEKAYEALILSYAIDHDLAVAGVRTSPDNHGKIREIAKDVESKRVLAETLAKESGEGIANSPVIEGGGEIDSAFFDNFSKSPQGRKFEALRQELKNRFPDATEEFDTPDASGIVIDLSGRGADTDAAKIATEINRFMNSSNKPKFDN